METQLFLSTLERYKDENLIFDLGERRVQPGYHVTEIKAANIQSVDCGGRADAWSETTVQLWVPGGSTEPYMAVGKFLSIYHRVTAQIPTAANAELRVEYGDVGAPAIRYLVREVQLEDEGVVVRLEPPHVACKAAERRVASATNLLAALPVAEASCCGGTPEQTACCG